ncbi:unnamed protein product [Mytilus coruscus]|uniref:Uncharacterized protein n=1 Tax=Mytilus coruscus TaxID=42192 RepID=A0A6J8EF58_MYTCO|nr:unnamed protein product [Mytilus coruscus]
MNILSNITNVEYFNRKRLSNGELKSYKYVRKPRKSIDYNFDNDSQKLAFDEKYEGLKRKMKVKSNVDILNILMDFYNQNCSTPKLEERINPIDNSGQDDQVLFVCSKQKLFELVRLSQWYGPLEPTEMTKIGHVARLVVKPVKTTSFAIFWHSSSALKQDFKVNYKLIHSYLCAGMFPA